MPVAGYLATRDGSTLAPSSAATAPATTSSVTAVADMPPSPPMVAALPATELPAPLALTDVAEVAPEAVPAPVTARIASAGPDMPTGTTQAEPAPNPAPTLAPPAPPIRHVSLPALLPRETKKRDAQERGAQDSASKPRRLATAAREAPAQTAPAAVPADATGRLARTAREAARPFNLPDALRPSR